MNLKRMRILALALIGACLAASLVVVPTVAEAAVSTDFKAAYVISDQKFFDTQSMSEAQVQAFLNSKVNVCAAGYTCLKDYRISTFDRAAVEPGHCRAYAGAANELASTIIYKAAQACGISPQVLLVLLQKETSLVTSTSPTSGTYRKATGYACPDSNVCDSAFYGFYNQVYKAVWQFRQYTNYPNRQYKIGNVSIGYHPNSACGSSVVNIQNQATANLYNYTPYQPNFAALSNLGGEGDACSSYGNRNFWVFFSDWFGSPTDGGNPIGNVELRQGVIGGIQVGGWAIDPDTKDSIEVHAYVDGVGSRTVANGYRSDVGQAYPSYGESHGFNLSLPVTSSGNHSVCVYGINTLSGVNSLFGCWDIVAHGGSPIGGYFTNTSTSGKVVVQGWALDPDTTASIPVHVYLDSSSVAVTASMMNSDIGSAYPGYGNAHGFSTTLDASPGAHRVCVYGINVASGSNANFGCSTVNVSAGVSEQGRTPVGAIDSVRGVSGGIDVGGWAIDLDTASAIGVHVYVDSGSTAFVANKSRPDVGAVYPAYGNSHGFSETVAAAPGNHRVCLFGINSGPGAHSNLGCTTVTVPGAVSTDQGRAPFGAIDSVRAVSGGIDVGGWAIDPDTASPIAVHVYVDAASTAFMANKTRTDVGAVYPASGNNHGFSETVAASAGSHRVCVYGINSGAGTHTLLGCTNVVIPGAVVTADQGRVPFGAIDSVRGVAGAIEVAGWAIDPDNASSIAVHIYVDSASTAYMANKTRNDVGAAYPASGNNHGFSEIVATGSGSHRVCVYGINSGPGPHTLLSCSTVVVS